MAHSAVLAVRLERQPHRDAVVRLREAYRRLRLSSQQPSPGSAQTKVAAKVPVTVQEVST
jgi:hypothetical protein